MSRDDVPPTCGDCYYLTYDGECGKTILFIGKYGDKYYKPIDTEDGGFETIPNWCPLDSDDIKDLSCEDMQE